MAVKYEEMLLHEFREAVETVPVAYIPCGLLEWHSSHLPLGIDGLKIEELGCRIAEAHGGVVFPPLYVGAPGFTGYEGTISYRPSTVQQVYVETFAELIKVGFKVIVAIGGHYGRGQKSALMAAADQYESQSNVAIWVLNEADVVEDEGIHGDHAGLWETSMGIELCAELVDLQRFVPGKQALNRYDIPERSDGLECEYRKTDFIIDHDLRTELDPVVVRKQVALVAERIGKQAMKLLATVMGK